MKKIKKMLKKIHYKNIDKLARFHTKNTTTHLHTTTTSAVIEVKTANSFNLFTITKSFLTVKINRLRYKNKIKSSSIITKI